MAEWSGIVPNEIIRNEHRERFRINYFRFHFVDGNSLAYTQLFKKKGNSVLKMTSFIWNVKNGQINDVQKFVEEQVLSFINIFCEVNCNVLAVKHESHFNVTAVACSHSYIFFNKKN